MRDKQKITAITKMRMDTWNGIADQNGYNKHFYRLYDEQGRIVGTQEGITTVPADLTPRQRLVDIDLSGFKPIADFNTVRPADVTLQPKANFVAEDGEPGDTLTVNSVKWRNVPIRDAAENLIKKD